MIRLHVTVAIAVFAFSTMVVALAATLTVAEPQQSSIAPGADGLAVRWESHDGWPAPQEPFDETPIGPVESAGAPMFP